MDMNRFTEDKLYVASQAFEGFEQQGIFAIPYGYALHFNPHDRIRSACGT